MVYGIPILKTSVFLILATGWALAQQPASNPSSSAAAPAQSGAAAVSQLSPEQQGDLLMAQKRYQAAIEAYKKGPRDSASNWNKLGIAYLMMYNYDNALRSFQASLKINPKNAQVMNNVGAVYDLQKNYNAAERMYRKALKIDPDSAVFWKNLGTDLFEQHKFKKGREAYQKAQAINPRIFERGNEGLSAQNNAPPQERGAMNYYMAESCARAGRTTDAIEYLRLSLNEGFASPKKILEDREFASLRGIPEFEQLLASQKEQ